MRTLVSVSSGHLASETSVTNVRDTATSRGSSKTSSTPMPRSTSPSRPRRRRDLSKSKGSKQSGGDNCGHCVYLRRYRCPILNCKYVLPESATTADYAKNLLWQHIRKHHKDFNKVCGCVTAGGTQACSFRPASESALEATVLTMHREVTHGFSVRGDFCVLPRYDHEIRGTSASLRSKRTAPTRCRGQATPSTRSWPSRACNALTQEHKNWKTVCGCEVVGAKTACTFSVPSGSAIDVVILAIHRERAHGYLVPPADAYYYDLVTGEWVFGYGAIQLHCASRLPSPGQTLNTVAEVSGKQCPLPMFDATFEPLERYREWTVGARNNHFWRIHILTASDTYAEARQTFCCPHCAKDVIVWVLIDHLWRV